MKTLSRDKSFFVGLVFLVLSIAATIYTVAAAVNYLNFYPGISSIQTQLDNFSIKTDSTTQRSTLDSHVTVSNPSNYEGFRLADETVYISFYVRTNASNTLFGGYRSLSGSNFVGGTLPSRSIVSADVLVQLNIENSTSLSQFRTNYPGQTVARILLRVEIITFLDSVTGRIPITTTQDISIP